MRCEYCGEENEDIGSIRIDSIYFADVFLRKFNLSMRSLRSMQKRGLIVIQDGKQEFIRGSDFSDFVHSLPKCKVPQQREKTIHNLAKKTFEYEEAKSEFEIQAWLFTVLIELGYQVQAEVQIPGGVVDLMIYINGNAVLGIETKSDKFNNYCKLEEQISFYHKKTSLPFVGIVGFLDAKGFIKAIKRDGLGQQLLKNIDTRQNERAKLLEEYLWFVYEQSKQQSA